MSNQMLQKKQSIKCMSGIKVIAVLLVFWWHSIIPKPPCDLGARMCELLFIISGFLVAYNYSNKVTNSSWKDSITYCLKKICQIWPLHLITFLLMLYRAELNVKSILTAVLNLSLFQSWSYNQDVFFSFNGISWFISSLMFCYFMSPLFIKMISKRKNTAVLLVLVTLIRFAVELIHISYPNYFFHISMHVSPLIRSMEFFMGMCVYNVFSTVKENVHISADSTKSKTLLTLFEIGIIIISSGLAIVGNGVLPRAVFVVLSCLLVFVFAFEGGYIAKFLSIKPFIWFSSIQLEFFLIHQVVMKPFNEHFFPAHHTYIGAMITISLSFILTILAACIYKKFLRNKLTDVMKRLLNRIFDCVGLSIKL